VRLRRATAVAALFLSAAHGACSDDPTDEGPPRIEASIERSATEADVFQTLGSLESVGPAGVEAIEVDLERGRVIIKLIRSADVRPPELAHQMHAARNEMLRLLREPASAIKVTSINWNPAP
jgi:hypothetical protein